LGKNVPKRLYANKSGVSAFVASVILVAILILIGIAISYWLNSAAGSYVKEEMKIVSVSAESADGEWMIVVKVKNTGSASISISNILLNQKPCANYVGDPWHLSLEADGVPVGNLSKINIVLKGGEEKKLVIITKAFAPFTSNVILEVRLRLVSGQEYSKEVTLK
jgi:hypothetical protein